MKKKFVKKRARPSLEKQEEKQQQQQEQQEEEEEEDANHNVGQTKTKRAFLKPQDWKFFVWLQPDSDSEPQLSELWKIKGKCDIFMDVIHHFLYKIS